MSTTNWYVSPDGSTWTTCASNNICNPVLTYRANGMDEMTFEIPGSITATPTYGAGTTIYLAFGTTTAGVTTYVCRFVGRITGIPATAAGPVETQRYTASGPWWWFEQITYAQYMNRYNGSAQAAIASPRVILGQRPNVVTGLVTSVTPIDAGAQISDIVSYAIAPLGASSGAPISLGTVDTLAILPISEHTNLRCSDGIRQCLRLQPDTVCWFDYDHRSGGIPLPQFNCRLASNLSTVNVPMFNTNLPSISLTPRYDIQMPGVVIQYETSSSVNGQTAVTTSYDTAGTITDPRTVKLLYPIQGPKTTTVQQKITALPYSGSPLDGTNGATIAWWCNALPWLATISSQPGYVSTDIAISGIGRSATGMSVYGFYLTEGQIAPWMNTSLSSPPVGSIVETWTAQISYTKRSSNGIEEQVISKNVSVVKVSTDGGGVLNSGNGYTWTYSAIASYLSGETIPSGVAAALYASWGRLNWDGDVDLVEQEATFSAMPGNLVNLTGGLSAWASMAANVQDAVVDLQTGVTKLRVGTCGRLEADNLVALWRAAHFWRVSTSLPTSMLSSASGDNVAGGSTLARHQPDNTDPGTHQAKMWTGTDAASKLHKVQINPAADITFSNSSDDLPQTIKLQEVKMLVKVSAGKYNAVNAQVLCSPHYDAASSGVGDPIVASPPGPNLIMGSDSGGAVSWYSQVMIS